MTFVARGEGIPERDDRTPGRESHKTSKLRRTGAAYMSPLAGAPDVWWLPLTPGSASPNGDLSPGATNVLPLEGAWYVCNSIDSIFILDVPELGVQFHALKCVYTVASLTWLRHIPISRNKGALWGRLFYLFSLPQSPHPASVWEAFHKEQSVPCKSRLLHMAPDPT